MALFRYRALSHTGKSLHGVIDADSLPLAKERLRKEKIYVTFLTPEIISEQERVLSSELLLAFTREIAQLLHAGLPLYESLLTIEEKYRSHKMHPLFLDLCDHLKRGSALSVALKKYPKTFDQIYLSMVGVAESTGNLEAVFEQLYQLIVRQQKLRKELTSALAYPTFLFAFCMLVVCGLFFFVVPSMQELFEGRQLHPMTAVVVAISKWLNAHVFSLGITLATLFTFTFIALRSKTGKAKIAELCLKIPFMKTVLLQSALVRFCRALAMLLQGGVPLLEALPLVRLVIKSPPLEQAVERAQAQIMQGERLSATFKDSPLLPPLIFRMVSLAEETGKMEDAFTHLAHLYDQELEKNLAQLTLYLQPALLILLGAIVGLVVLSILLPLTDVSSFVST